MSETCECGAVCPSCLLPRDDARVVASHGWVDAKVQQAEVPCPDCAPLRERIKRVADELHLDLDDAYTRVLATAMAATEPDAMSAPATILHLKGLMREAYRVVQTSPMSLPRTSLLERMDRALDEPSEVPMQRGPMHSFCGDPECVICGGYSPVHDTDSPVSRQEPTT